MALCPALIVMCAPDGVKVVQFLDTETGTSTYLVAGTGATWTGDPTTLGACGTSPDTYGLMVDNGDGTFSWTSADGATTFNIDVCAIVAANCAATAVDNGDGTYTITGTDGQAVTIGGAADTDTFGLLVDNGDGTFGWTSADGLTTFAIDPCAIVLANCGATAVDNADGTYTITGNDGNPVTITEGAADTDTFGLLVDNGDGTYTWTSADGATTFTFSSGSDIGEATATDNGDNTATIAAVDTAGTATTVTVIENLLVNDGAVGVSRDIVPASDILLHDGNVVDSASWPLDCPVDSGQVVYKAPDGRLYTIPNDVCKKAGFAAAVPDLAAVGGPYTRDANGPVLVPIWDSPDHCFTNDDPCGRSMKVRTQIQYQRFLYQADPGQVFNIFFQFIRDGGTPITISTHYENLNCSTGCGRQFYGAVMSEGFDRVFTLPPGATTCISTRISIQQLNNGTDGAAAFIPRGFDLINTYFDAQTCTEI